MGDAQYKCMSWNMANIINLEFSVTVTVFILVALNYFEKLILIT